LTDQETAGGRLPRRVRPLINSGLESAAKRFALAQRAPAARDFGAFLLDRRWFFIALLVGFIILQLPPPEGLNKQGLAVLAMSVVAIILFVTEPIPLPSVALLIVLGQVILLGIDSDVVARSLMSDSVLFILGSPFSSCV
jgi:hypothetical protein